MIKCIEFPNRVFATKSELFKALQSNASILIDMKKAAKNSEPIKAEFINSDGEIVKGIDVKDGGSLHVINTTNVLDSHNDLHVKGIWTKSVKEQKGKIFFLADHDMAISSVIAHPKDVNMSVKELVWKDLGFDFEGSTDALVFEIDTEKVRHKEARHIIENKVDIQHSVRMSYVKVELAINSDDKDFKSEKKVWDKFLSEMVNKSDAESIGFFWVVKEAKIEREGSMVLLGSNHATPMINSKIESEVDEEIKEKNDKEDSSYLYY